jgi:ribokinase
MPERGETLLAGPVSTSAGGKGSNQAVAASRLGATVALLTAVGEDAFAQAGRALWAAEKIEASAVRVSAGPTMLGVILLEPTADNRIVVAPGALDDLDEQDVARFADRIAAAGVCVVSLEIPVRAAVAALETAHRAGTTSLLNPAPPVPLPAAVLRRVDVVTPNRPEAVVLTGSAADATPEELVDRLRERCDGAIVLTLGPDGALVDDGRERYRVPAPRPERVVDTTGAGDAFTGALASALAHGVPLRNAVTVAVAAGTHSVTIGEVIPSLPVLADLPDVRAMLSGSAT